jgi:hypothetical protein
VTVNLLIRRTPPPKEAAQLLKIDGVPLKRALDKGFPYDDADITHEEWAKPHTQLHNLGEVESGKIVAMLSGHNITEAAIQNLVRDKPAPLTMKLAEKAPAATTLL